MKRIDKLTPAQQSRFGEWTRKWIDVGLSTEPADFEAATQAALKAYALCNLGKPMVVLRMGSPYAATVGGAMAWMMLREFFKGTNKVWAQVGDQVRDQVWDRVMASKFSRQRTANSSLPTAKQGTTMSSQNGLACKSSRATIRWSATYK